MTRRITVTFIAPNDPDFGSSVESVVQLAPDILLSIDSDELTFRLPANNGAVVNLETCRRFAVENFGKVDPDWLAQVSLLDFIRRIAK